MKKNFHKFLGVSILPALLVMPAMAGTIKLGEPAFVLGDIALDATDQVSVGKAAFAGRRMDHWEGNKYQNDFPKYEVVAQSFSANGSDMYVGPITLELRKLKDTDNFVFNWQDSENDIDLAQIAGVGWNEDLEDTVDEKTEEVITKGVRSKVADIINPGNAAYTAPTVHQFSQKDTDATNDGVLDFNNTTAMVDGSTIIAKKINVRGGSVLTFSEDDHSKLGAFLQGEISSDGVTTLNADNIDIDGSSMIVKKGAKLVINPTTSAIIHNVTSNFGALTVNNNGNGSIETNGESLVFDNNKSTSHGAALYYKDQSYGLTTDPDVETYSVVLNTKNIAFTNNVSEYKESSGGAVFNTGGLMSIAGTKNTFSGNKILKLSDSKAHKRGGGAIANQSYELEGSTAQNPNPIDADMFIGKLDGSSINVFSDNTSSMNGGAVMNRAVDTDGNATLTIRGTTTFANNHANLNGGALYNHQNSDIEKTAKVFLDKGDYTFNGNTADGQGGAIYNDGILTIAGNATFTGNTAADGEANDIHNIGVVNIVGGKTTLDGGITGDGTLTIAEGATLNIGKATITQGTINLGGTLVADLVDGADPIFNVSTLFKDDGGKLRLAIEKEGTYNLFSDKQFAKAQTQVTSSVYDLDWETIDGSVIATKKSVAKIVEDTGLGTQSAATLSHIADSAAIETSPKQMRDLSLRLQEKLAEAETNPAAKAEVEHATKAIHPETESVAQSVSSSVQNTVVSLASSRMAAPSVGRNGGDVELTAGGVWAQGLFNKSKQNDAFSGYTRGIAVGMDGTLNKHWTVGAGYSYAHSDIDGTARNTEIDSNTVFLYGQYKPAAWYLNAIANYTWSDYSEKGTVIDDALVFADYNVSSFGGALNAGYDFDNGITPELGLRYMHVNANDYANSYGIKTHVDGSDYLTGVLGAKYAFTIAATKHATFMPQLNAGVKYDLLSDKNVATVTMPGVDAYSLEGNRLNRVGGEFGIGLGMQYDSLNVSVNYDIDVRKDYTSQTGMLKLRYNF